MQFGRGDLLFKQGTKYFTGTLPNIYLRIMNNYKFQQCR